LSEARTQYNTPPTCLCVIRSNSSILLRVLSTFLVSLTLFLLDFFFFGSCTVTPVLFFLPLFTLLSLITLITSHHDLQPGPLANTLTLIPGGTRGIGLATAKLFATNGSRIVILGRDQDRINHVLEHELAPTASGSGHVGFRCDVSKLEDVEHTIKVNRPT
jgi:hypothetical protein